MTINRNFDPDGFCFSRRSAIGIGCGAAALAVGAGLLSMFNKRSPFGEPDTGDNTGSGEADSKDIVYDGVLPYMAAALSPQVAMASDIHDTESLVHVQIVIADASKMSDSDTVDSLWRKYNHQPDAFFGMQDIYVPMYDAGLSDYYVALAWKEGMFGGVMPKDVTFARDHDMAEMITGCEFDFESGLVRIPRSLVDGYSYENVHDTSCPVRAQFLLPVSLDNLPEVRTHYSLVDAKGTVLAEDIIVGDVWDTELCIEYALPESEGYGFDITLDGTEEVAHVPSISAFYDFDSSLIVVPMAPACTPGVVIRILNYEAPSVVSAALSVVMPRKAYGRTDADTMIKYGYGRISHDPQLQAGFYFSYRGRFRYPSLAQVQEAINTYYNRPGIGSSTYSYYKEYYITYVSGDPAIYEWESADATGFTNWESVSDVVYRTELGGIWDNGRQIARYYGELFTMLGADGTYQYTFKDRDYFSSLKGPYEGIVPCGCMHQEQANLGSPYGQFIDTEIKVRVLKVNTDVSNPYIIMAFATVEIQHDTYYPDHWSQGGSAIYKLGLIVYGTLKVTKIVDTPDTDTINNDVFSFRVDFSGEGAPASQTFSLRNGESKVIQNIQGGVVATVSETEHNHYDTIWDPTSRQVTIPGGYQEVSVTATNKRRVGSLDVVKKVDGPYPDYKFRFNVKIYRDDAAHSLYANYDFTLSQNDGAHRISNIPSDYTYVVTESWEDHFRLSGIENGTGTIVADQVITATATNIANGYVSLEKGLTL